MKQTINKRFFRYYYKENRFKTELKMKQVKITIVGTPVIVEYCSKSVMEESEDGFFGNYYMTVGWDNIEGLYVDVPENTFDFEDYDNLVRKKGKYVKTVEYFHKLFAEDGNHPLPVELHARQSHSGESLDYIIELEDDEEFDIKKVQLIKSDYEIECLPYFILAEQILYDGKDVEVVNDNGEYSDYSIDGKYCNEYEVDGFVNGD